MDTKKKSLLGIAIVIVLGASAMLSATNGRDRGVEVRTEAVGNRDIVELVTASGNIRARRTVDVSSDVSAKVAELHVDEGDDVVAGQLLLRLEQDQHRAALSRSEASFAQAQAQHSQQEASLLRARRNLDRFVQLRARDSLLVSTQQLDDARTEVDVATAMVESAAHGVDQARAAVEESTDQLSKTLFRAPMDGKVTRLNVEEGETVIIGTMNNPGSLVLTISDLSVIEVVVQVDETDVSSISLGDSATIRIDAFRDETFVGRVTEIGNSAINPPTQQSGGQQAAIDFEVVLTLDASDTPLRPDLSATADIVTEMRHGVPGVPIIAMTVRADSSTAGVDEGEPLPEVEGAFVVRAGQVEFVPVRLGIAGQEYFEVLDGLSVGDSIVAGPYQRIRQLREGDAVRTADESTSTDQS